MSAFNCSSNRNCGKSIGTYNFPVYEVDLWCKYEVQTIDVKLG